jgi:plastocyanin
VEVGVKNAAGDPFTTATADITLILIGSGIIPPGATLNGHTTRPATNGVAVFSDLSITKAASGYFLTATASSGEIAPASASTAFAVLPGPATAIAMHAGNGQAAAAGRPVLQPPSVVATDEFGNPVPGVSVAFEVASGGGTVDGAQATTAGFGIARVGSWTLGSSPGANTLRATSGTLTGSPVVFTATALDLPTAVTIEVHDDYFLSLRNGSGRSIGGNHVHYARDTIAAGGTVTWVWKGENHNVAQWFRYNHPPEQSLSETHDAPFTLGPITFSSPGTVFYRCTNHSSLAFGGEVATGEAGMIVIM